MWSGWDGGKDGNEMWLGLDALSKLSVRRFHICNFIFFLRLSVTPRSIASVLSWSLTDRHMQSDRKCKLLSVPMTS